MPDAGFCIAQYTILRDSSTEGDSFLRHREYHVPPTITP